MLVFLNYFFFAFHTFWLLFIATGWAWRRTRPYHLGVIALTSASWFVLGYWYGWGYCFCTDWHSEIRRRLGYPPFNGSYTRFLLRALFGLDLSQAATDTLNGTVFGVVTVLTLALLWRDRRSGQAA